MPSGRRCVIRNAMPAPTTPQPVTIDELAARYRVLLLDAYGVLVDGAGALPAATAILDAIRAHERSFLVLTNDASRLPDNIAARFARLGLEIPVERIISSGSLVSAYFADRGLSGARCMVLGPEDCRAYVRAAGGVIAPIAADSPIDALIVGDEEGFPFLEGVEAALNAVARQIRAGRDVALVVPNPDLIAPTTGGDHCFTSGGVALLIEAGLARLFPEQAAELRFVGLGKPNAAIFERARDLAQTDDLVMIGDQLQTDIAGAQAAGIDSALIDTGISQWRADDSIPWPDFLLKFE